MDDGGHPDPKAAIYAWLTKENLRELVAAVNEAFSRRRLKKEDIEDAIFDGIETFMAEDLPADPSMKLWRVPDAWLRLGADVELLHCIYKAFERNYKRCFRERNHLISESSIDADSYVGEFMLEYGVLDAGLDTVSAIRVLQKIPCKLSPGEMNALERHIGGMSYEEIAQEKGVAVSTINNQMSTARKKIRKIMSEYW